MVFLAWLDLEIFLLYIPLYKGTRYPIYVNEHYEHHADEAYLIEYLRHLSIFPVLRDVNATP